MKVDLRLYAILDPERTHGRDLAELARAAAAGGATLLQYRDKYADTRDLVARARAIKAALAGTGVPLLVNDRVDVALAAGADGVHVGQNDMHADDARRLLGPQAIIGITLKKPEHVAELAALPVDYGCIGGVFATASKDNPDPPVGLSGLAHLASNARTTRPGLPVGAIAGIDASNAAAVIGAGADGIAVISAIFMAQDVKAATRNLRGIVDASLARRASGTER